MAPKRPAPPKLKASSSSKKPTLNKSSSSSSESESDQDNVQLMGSKPVQGGTSKGKKQQKPMSVSPPLKSAASVGVKSGGLDYRKSAKKIKVAEGRALEEEPMQTESEFKKPFQRVWTEEDEIALLQGMIDFSSEEGADPSADMAAFHVFIRKLLHLDASRVQLSDKIRRLKKKFENNSARVKNGKNPKFTNPHEEKTFELSKKVWGGGGVNEKVVADSSKPVLSSGLSFCFTALTRLGLDEQMVRRGMELVEPSKRVELEERWILLGKNEMELDLQKAEIAMQTAREILEAYDASSNN